MRHQHLDAHCYHGGAFYQAIGEDFRNLERSRQVINADVLDAWFDPAPAVLAVLQERLPWILKTSPPTQASGMRHAIATARGLPPATILPGGGSSDLIFLALGRLLSRGNRVLILDPMYGEYSHVLERVIGCQVDRLPLRRDQGYGLDLGVLAERIAQGYDAVLLVNPNSPTGQFTPSQRLAEVLAQAPAKTWLWVDETYLNYVDEGNSLEILASQSQRLLVCVSMSKTYALSGARCAYLCGPEAVLHDLRQWTPPWSVSHAAQIAACVALENLEYYRTCWLTTTILRQELSTGLRDLGLDPVPGVANFVLAHLTADHPRASQVIAYCQRQNLYLRDVTSMGQSWGEDVIRIAVKDRTTNARMLAILAGLLAA
jgi:histidinol-phosphate/aromatic aminotransferase/cobyric acid decarboxylase-like protein